MVFQCFQQLFYQFLLNDFSEVNWNYDFQATRGIFIREYFQKLMLTNHENQLVLLIEQFNQIFYQQFIILNFQILLYQIQNTFLQFQLQRKYYDLKCQNYKKLGVPQYSRNSNRQQEWIIYYHTCIGMLRVQIWKYSQKYSEIKFLGISIDLVLTI
ncbi:unnamed protein product [Paramecium octaurelia]|uniref:Uncharacterized protein n=1 Tax=Paramecium octaurelia TaxID=43137 RepID=A0A8S1WHR5_PAROT|nr:unnamed protein product [Paramecium octaurelia]